MGLGLLLLASVGKENLYISAQPEITFFKIAYKRYTNYSIEPTPQYFKTTPDFGRRCTVNISKNADLLGQTYLYVELPDIIPPIPSNPILQNIKKMAWVNKIGISLINFIEFDIGGVTVDRHYADWLNIWQELTNKKGNNNGYNKMIGNIDILTKYDNNKSSYILYIPFSFWFCLDYGLALPLLALFNNDIKIHVDFNDISKCYNQTPDHYININEDFSLFNYNEIIKQNVNGNIALGRFIYYDVISKNLYYTAIKSSFLIPNTNNDISYIITGRDTNYKINIASGTYIYKDEDYFKYMSPSINTAYLLSNYIFLDNTERIYFMKNSHDYIVPVIQNLPIQTVNSLNVKYKLSLFNPCKLLIWHCVLQSNNNINDSYNYSTTPYTIEHEDIIINHKVIINSVETIQLYTPEYYTLLPKYQYNIESTNKCIYMYSFCLNPLSTVPSGTINFSRIDDAYLQLTMNKIISYQNPAILRGYSVFYSIFRVDKGIGGLLFNS
jgi:hypothetical protein